MTQSEWEPVLEKEVLSQRSRNTFLSDKRNKAANDFKEVLCNRAYNTSAEDIREIGWYLWLYFGRRSRRDISWSPPSDWEKQVYYYYYLHRPTTADEMLESYEKRLEEALSEWVAGTR